MFRAAACRPCGLALVAALLAGAAHAETPVYGENFESGVAGSAWSGAGSVLSTGGLSGVGLGAQHLKNDVAGASVLSLSGLGAHSSITLSFDLVVWDSVDSNPGTFPYGDRFLVQLDGTTVLDEAFGNYGDAQPVAPGTRLDSGSVNHGYGYWIDTAWHVTLNVKHTSGTAEFSFLFPNTQGGSDEAFGLDNVAVSITPVPEPGTWALMGGGVLMLGALRRRTRRD